MGEDRSDEVVENHPSNHRLVELVFLLNMLQARRLPALACTFLSRIHVLNFYEAQHCETPSNLAILYQELCRVCNA